MCERPSRSQAPSNLPKHKKRSPSSIKRIIQRMETFMAKKKRQGTSPHKSQSQTPLLIKHPYLCLAKERIVHAMARNLWWEAGRQLATSANAGEGENQLHAELDDVTSESVKDRWGFSRAPGNPEHYVSTKRWCSWNKLCPWYKERVVASQSNKKPWAKSYQCVSLADMKITSLESKDGPIFSNPVRKIIHFPTPIAKWTHS